jgi:hypothetical protein
MSTHYARFDGKTGHLRYAHDDGLARPALNNQLTIDVRFRVGDWFVHNTARWFSLVDKEWTLEIQDAQHVLTLQEIQFPAIFQRGQWYRVVVTTDGAVSRAWIDGQALPAVTRPLKLRTASVPLDVGFGKYGVPEYANGDFTHVRVWSRALTEAEVAALLEGKPPAEAPELDVTFGVRDDAGVAIDSSPAQRKGELVGKVYPENEVEPFRAAVVAVRGSMGGRTTFKRGDQQHSLLATLDFELDRPGWYVSVWFVDDDRLTEWRDGTQLFLIRPVSMLGAFRDVPVGATWFVQPDQPQRTALLLGA